ncbi:uncharacterized protein LOC115404278 [Salarias fasciatus]|uniref:uncharacterized protein LOC115404278 n=1 Tax=Salarias fasciatus TaxID=181472 RepID=UPI001176E0E2|nr:uncharacterized protein LOC115404278 [Salarias fasciatus]
MNKSFIFLKYGLLVFSLLVGIVGVLMFTSVIYLTVSVTQSFNPIWIGLILTRPWIITLVTLGLAALGTYGSIAEKTTPLHVFYVLMWIITAILAGNGIRIIFEVTSEVQQGLLKPLSIVMGIIFGLASLTDACNTQSRHARRTGTVVQTTVNILLQMRRVISSCPEPGTENAGSFPGLNALPQRSRLNLSRHPENPTPRSCRSS